MEQSTQDVYECHITVDGNGLEEQERFFELCKSKKIKAIRIELPYGKAMSQLMTASIHKGYLEKVRDEVYGTARFISDNGFNVVRRKIESMIQHNENYPKTESEAVNNYPKGYFEFHVKITEPDSKLEEICKEHEAHLSRSVSSKLNGKNQKFATARYHQVGRAEAEGKFERFISDLKERNYSLSNLLKEFSVMDDNFGLDGSWGALPTVAYCHKVCQDSCPFMEKI